MIHYVSNARERTTFCGRKAKRVKETTSHTSKVTCPECKKSIANRAVRNVREKLGGRFHEVDALTYTIRVENGGFKGKVFNATGEFRMPVVGEFFIDPDRQIVRQYLGGAVKVHAIILKEAKIRKLLTEEIVLDWLLGYRQKPLVIECHACSCDGWVGPVYVRTSPFHFNKIGIFHSGKDTTAPEALAYVVDGEVILNKAVERGNVYVVDDEKWRVDW